MWSIMCISRLLNKYTFLVAVVDRSVLKTKGTVYFVGTNTFSYLQVQTNSQIFHRLDYSGLRQESRNLL